MSLSKNRISRFDMAEHNPDVISMQNELSSGYEVDVRFLFDGERKVIEAHKYVLRNVSDVFDRMFSFDEKVAESSSAMETDGGSVPIVDTKFAVFKAMMDCIYAGDATAINAENLTGVLKAADKYNVQDVVNACLSFDFAKLPDIFNVYCAYAGHIFGNLEKFAQKCLEYIDQNACTLFVESVDFLGLEEKMLCKILARDQLNVEEVTLWNAAIRWADKRCSRNEGGCSGENRRKILGSALFKIRLPLIPQEDFASQIVPTDVLTKDEMLGIFLYYSQQVHSQRYPLRFSCQPRALQDEEQKAKSRIVLGIEHFSTFMEEENGDSQRSSDAVIVRGIPWKVFVIPETKEDVVVKFFNVVIECGIAANSPSVFPCCATVRILSQEDGKKDLVRKFFHIFHSQSHQYVIREFTDSDDLMFLDNGWYNEESDKVTFAIDIIVEQLTDQ